MFNLKLSDPSALENTNLSAAQKLTFDMQFFRNYVAETLKNEGGLEVLLQTIQQNVSDTDGRVSSKFEKYLYTQALQELFMNLQGDVSQFISQTLNFIYRPEVSHLIKEAVIEVLIDNEMMVPEVQADYGIQVLATREEMQGRVQELRPELEGREAHNLVVLSGAAHVASILDVTKYIPITMSTTEGQASKEPIVEQSSLENLRALLDEDPLCEINIVEDVIDTSATLCKLLEEILIIKLGNFTDPEFSLVQEELQRALIVVQELRKEIKEMNEMEPNFAEDYEAKRSEVRTRFEDLLSVLGEYPFHIKMVVGANKLLNNHTDLEGVQFIAKSFAHDHETGELLPKDKLHWLMGLGLDTGIKLLLDTSGNTVELSVSLGRLLPDIVGMVEPSTDRLAGFNTMQRLRLLIVEVLGKYGIHPNQIIWPGQVTEA